MVDEKALNSVVEFYKGRDLSWNDASDIIIRYESARAPQVDEKPCKHNYNYFGTVYHGTSPDCYKCSLCGDTKWK